MRDEDFRGSAGGPDWKALGYLVSMASVLLLGAIAWPRPDAPGWHVPALIAGIAASILGMAFRYKAHLDQKRELRKTKAEAEGRQS
jgi:hypothetical protein